MTGRRLFILGNSFSKPIPLNLFPFLYIPQFSRFTLLVYLTLSQQDPPGLEELARRLNCSSRSLRRHLQQPRTSYQQLLDELRFAGAKELLQSGDMPIYRIAEELGFSETASLRHAFQRWSGQPPSHFRA